MADEMREELGKDLRDVKRIVEDLEAQVRQGEERIREYEERYGMESEEFLRRWEAGLVDREDEDLQDWAMTLYYIERLRPQVRLLRAQLERDARSLGIDLSGEGEPD